MTLTEKIKEYRIPTISTPENLESRWGTVLEYGDTILLAGHYYTGRNKACYFGAVYKYINDSKTTCEDEVVIIDASEVEFEDKGHAIEWAIRQ